MSGEQFLIMGYVVGVLILWGYGALLWYESRTLRRREAAAGADNGSARTEE